MQISFLDAAVPDIIETSGGSTLFVIILAVVVAAAGTLIWVKSTKSRDSRETGENSKEDSKTDNNETNG